jgi:hypothetical protein
MKEEQKEKEREIIGKEKTIDYTYRYCAEETTIMADD